MLRYSSLLVLVVTAAVVTASRHPRVQFFDSTKFDKRDDAMAYCTSLGHCIAHQNQIKADIQEGFEHSRCGYTWRRDGLPVHGHCYRKDAEGKCTRKDIMASTCSRREAKHGVYCRVQREGETLPECKISDSDVNEIFHLEGPFKSEYEAIAGCEQAGAVLATWTQAAHFASFYEVQFCQYNFLKVTNDAVYRVNCHHDGQISWRIKDSDGRGYGALCYGRPEHKWHNLCRDKYPVFKEHKLHCTKDNYIIFQDRPVCDKENHNFEEKNTWSAWKNGFGDIDEGGYWLGLEPLTQLTNEHECSLRVEFTDHNDKLYFAEYGKFRVDGENSGVTPCEAFKLTVDDYKRSSTAPDALNEPHGDGSTDNYSFFSDRTHDCDNEPTLKCSEQFHSGWWFGACQRGNLNGVCDDSPNYDMEKDVGRFWYGVNSGTGFGLKTTRMMFKCHDDGED